MIKNAKNLFIITLMITFVALALNGCSIFNKKPDAPLETPAQTPSYTPESKIEENKNISELNNQLAGMLPKRENFRWRYNGFAEYGHTMTLKYIEKSGNEIKYHIDGIVDDPSGGEGNKEPGYLNLKITYTIKDCVLIQTKTEKAMMDSIFDSLELLRAPLNKNSKWVQEQVDKSGKQYTLEAEITGIKEEGGLKTYTVMYKDKNGDYYEKRDIKEGFGVISFEKLWKDRDNNSYQIGYSLYSEASGYESKLQLDSLLPPLDKNLRYFGLAEYGHNGVFKLVSSDSDSSVYEFNGEFDDGSGIPDKFKVQYTLDYINGTVTEKVLENTRTGKKEVNSIIPEHIIMKLPLSTGTEWEQSVEVDGKQYNMNGLIVSVAYKGNTDYSPGVTDYDKNYPVVTVRYKIHDMPGYFKNTYIEEREFQAGRGMIGFGKLMPGDIGLSEKDIEDGFKVEEALINHMFGYSLAIE